MTILHQSARRQPDALLGALRKIDTGARLDAEALNGRRRFRIWELSPNLHCSIVGTCLTTGDVRQILIRLGQPDARSASDHELHRQGVAAAGRHDAAGKMLNKHLDRKHETAIKRMAGATTGQELLEHWRRALDEGDVPGGYWATLSHPACNPAIIREVFGEVHMLSHLVGQSNRLDLARLRKLETALADAHEKIARQEERLRQSALERAELIRKAEATQLDLSQRLAAAQSLAKRAEEALDAGGAMTSPADAARSESLAQRNRELEAELAEERQRTQVLRRDIAALSREIALLDELVTPQAAGERPLEDLDLSGLTLLYVGGRPKLVEQLRAIVEGRGGRLLSHDGGVEDNPALLPGLQHQADATFFPVDCVSHKAAEQIKKFARLSGKPFVPLRKASAACLLAALAASRGQFDAAAE